MYYVFQKRNIYPAWYLFLFSLLPIPDSNFSTDQIVFTPAGSFRAQKCKDIRKPGHLVHCLEGTVSEYYPGILANLARVFVFLFFFLFRFFI